MGNTFVIGDIHGCSQHLSELLATITPVAGVDTVIFLGDYINRGPDSKGVIEIILGLRQSSGKVVALMGNHEFMLLQALQGRNIRDFLSIGGEATLKSYGIAAENFDEFQKVIPSEHLVFFQELLPYWEDSENIYVHAGLKPGLHLTQQPKEWLLWARESFTGVSWDFGKRVIYGHTPFEEPVADKYKIGLDTGAVYGGKLTCLILPEIKFVSV